MARQRQITMKGRAFNMSRNARFRRRPNNSGTVIKLPGNRRKPYCARISTDSRDLITGRKKQISIGTFETREEALNALSLYNLTKAKKISEEEADQMMPDLYQQIQRRTQKKIPTFEEIYQILDEEEFSKLSKSARTGYHSWFGHFKIIHSRKINTIALADLQDIFDRDRSSNGTQVHMKVLCSKIFEYAVIHQYIKRDEDYTSYIKVADYKKSTKHYSFTIDEIRKLKKLDTPEAHIILIYIYTGLRVSELLGINRSNIHIDELCNDDGTDRLISYIVAGSKTEAGKNRIIPIHDDIKQFVIDDLLKPEQRLIDFKQTRFNILVLNVINKQLKTTHTMHDTRKTFASLCQLNNINIYIRKKVLGHKMNDITFDVYTNESKNVLFKEINKIKI